MEVNDPSKLALSGVRIVDWTIRAAGPCATWILADMGAEVIKVENPKGGDPERGSLHDRDSFLMLPHGFQYTFETKNRNKKSLAVDLSREEGKQLVYALIAKSDAFVQNYRFGVAKKLKLDYETLKKYNPSLVYANCTGYGRKGKQAAQPALDPAIHAASGMMLGIGEENMPPIHLPGAIADATTAIMLACSLMIGLFSRERTGKGQEIDVSMLGTMIWVQTNNILYSMLAKKSRPRQLRTKPPNPLVNHYRCQDGGWILLAHFQPDKYWPALCRSLGLETLIDDPQFCNLKARKSNSAELVSILDKTFATRTRDAWLSAFSAYDLIYSPIKDYCEVAQDPQVLENNFISEYAHPVLGKLKEIGTPMEFSDTPATIRSPAPLLGQHNEEVPSEILGLSREEIEKLRGKGIIPGP